MLTLPSYILTVLDTLEKAGYETYIVGGSVRDLLRGEIPVDFDMATAALPEDVKRLFPHTVDTGIRHGTVTVCIEDTLVEVTTFRTDGLYHDSRRPDTVHFVSRVEEDLGRRDFTINAMAYHPERGLLDLYGGQQDLQNQLIRAVGVPKKRFNEDALRILRCVRFAAQLGFSIEEETQKAAEALCGTLQNISHERIFAELTKTISAAEACLYQKTDKIWKSVLPEAMPLSPEKCRQVAARKTIEAKWAVLCGEKTQDVLKKLKAPKKLQESAGELASYSMENCTLSDIVSLRKNTVETLADYCQNQALLQSYQAARKRAIPFSPKELKISGETLKTMGLQGAKIGETIDMLLLLCVTGRLPNQEESLKEAVISLCLRETLPKV